MLPGERKREIQVGGFVLLGLLAVAVMTVMLGSEEGIFRPRVRLRSVFANSGGLRPGAPVLLAGLNVGAVTGLRFTEAGSSDDRARVEVLLEVDQRQLEFIRGDSVATIGSVGLLGDKSIEISVGNPDSPAVQADALLPTEEPLSLGAMIEQVGPMVSKLDAILSDVSVLSHELAGPERPIVRSLESLDSILDRIDRGEGTIGHLAASSATAEALDSTLLEARAAFADVQAATADLPATMASIRQAADDVAAISAELRQAAKVLPAVAEDAAVLARNARLASASLPAIAVQAEQGVRKASDVFDAAGQSVLLRGAMPAPAGQAPVSQGREGHTRLPLGQPLEASNAQH